MAYEDPRLVALYDADNPAGPDHAWFRGVADEIGARSVLDLGCGTGLLTVTLAAPGRTVVGVDPSAAMLAAASARVGGDRVRWVLGDIGAVPAGPYDYAVMSGNVVQHVLDPDWERTLERLHDALAVGGTLAFENRNPRVRAWTRWTDGMSTVRPTGHGPLRERAEADEVAPGLVRLTAYHRFEDTGEEVVEELMLAFRDRPLVERQLEACGFAVEAVHGDWSGGPFTDASALMVVRARRD